MVLRVGSKLWYIPEAKVTKVTKAISLRMDPRASWLTLRPPSKTNPDPNLGRCAPCLLLSQTFCTITITEAKGGWDTL